jgi:hypothetical protein
LIQALIRSIIETRFKFGLTVHVRLLITTVVRVHRAIVPVFESDLSTVGLVRAQINIVHYPGRNRSELIVIRIIVCSAARVVDQHDRGPRFIKDLDKTRALVILLTDVLIFCARRAIYGYVIPGERTPRNHCYHSEKLEKVLHG